MSNFGFFTPATDAFKALAKIQTPLNQAYAFKMGIQGNISVDRCIVCGKTGDFIGLKASCSKYFVMHCQTNYYCQDMAHAIMNVYIWHERHQENARRPRKEINWLFVQLLADSTYLTRLTFDMKHEQEMAQSFAREKIRLEMAQNSKELESKSLESPDDLQAFRLGDFPLSFSSGSYIVIEEPADFIKEEDPVEFVSVSVQTPSPILQEPEIDEQVENEWVM